MQLLGLPPSATAGTAQRGDPGKRKFFFLFFCAAGSKNNTAQKTNNKINAQTDSHLSSLSNRPPFLLLLLPLLLPPLKVSDGLKPGNTHTQL